MAYPLDLGGAGWSLATVTAASPAVRMWLDCGWVHTMGFNVEEAVRCFQVWGGGG